MQSKIDKGRNKIKAETTGKVKSAAKKLLKNLKKLSE